MNERIKNPQTPSDVREAVAFIASEAFDPEIAHSDEDLLREHVLVLIADGHPDAKELAAEVLKTSEIKFDRWMA